MQYVYIYLITVPIFFIIDVIWIGLVAQKFYTNQIGHLMGATNWSGAIIFYLIYIVGILLFAVIPALDAASLQKAVLWGALFGFFTYATYDFTNWATLRDWPFMMVIVDVLWGTILSATVASLSYTISRWLLF